MSTARFDNWAPSAGGTAVSMAGGLAKAWANLNGTGTIALRDSENVSSVTDNGNGDYTFTYTNAMTDANYASSADAQLGTAGLIALHSVRGDTSLVQTTNSTRLYSVNSSFSQTDALMRALIIHGDLA